MFCFDVETLGKDSTAVILSMACVAFDPTKRPSPQELRDDAFFVKFDVEDQIKRLHRTTTKSTMEWWAKQCDNVKFKSFRPSVEDVIFEDGYEAMRVWAAAREVNDKDYVWARGNLDQLVLDSIEEQCELKPIFFFNRWRDVRTAIDFMYGTTSGYVDVDYPGFDYKRDIQKHNPVHDVMYDVMQLIYGKEQ
jgi:hypothetical protein